MKLQQIGKRIAALFLIGLIGAILSGCDFDSSSESISTEKLREQLSSKWDKLVENPEVSVKEFKKLKQLEYKVVSVPERSSNASIETLLSSLGQERWDCRPGGLIADRLRGAPGRASGRQGDSSKERAAGPGTGDAEMIFVCKRTPDTILRYLPSSILGR